MAGTNMAMLQRTHNSAAADECYTPENAILPLLPYLDARMTWCDITSGKSQAIVNCMCSNGFDCRPSTGDYFETGNPHDGTVTNPPYSIKDKFLRKAYDEGKPFAMLLPVSAFQGLWRGEMFAAHGVDVLVLNGRPNFTGGSGAHFGVAWFTWGILPERLIFADLAK